MAESGKLRKWEVGSENEVTIRSVGPRRSADAWEAAQVEPTWKAQPLLALHLLCHVIFFTNYRFGTLARSGENGTCNLPIFAAGIGNGGGLEESSRSHRDGCIETSV